MKELTYLEKFNLFKKKEYLLSDKDWVRYDYGELQLALQPKNKIEKRIIDDIMIKIIDISRRYYIINKLVTVYSKKSTGINLKFSISDTEGDPMDSEYYSEYGTSYIPDDIVSEIVDTLKKKFKDISIESFNDDRGYLHVDIPIYGSGVSPDGTSKSEYITRYVNRTI